MMVSLLASTMYWPIDFVNNHMAISDPSISKNCLMEDGFPFSSSQGLILLFRLLS